ncbi:MAG: hypothetical protein V4857_21305 [Pseudomonadota bacterium]
MKIDSGLAQRNRKNDRLVIRWLLIGSISCLMAFAGFLIWHTSVARHGWFERERLFEDHGVEVNAIAVGKQCSFRSVTYKWTWEGKDFSGTGWACDTTCDAMTTGTEVAIRFVPAQPKLIRCTPTDIETITGPPSHWADLFPFGLACFFLFKLVSPVIKWRRRKLKPSPESRDHEGR